MSAYDIDAEESIIGAMLLSQQAVAEAAGCLVADDFYSPLLAGLFATCVELHRQGAPVDAVTVAAAARERVEPAKLLYLQNNTPSTRNVAHYAKIVRRHRFARATQVFCQDALKALAEGEDPQVTADVLVSSVRSAERPLAGGEPEGRSMEDLIEHGDVEAPWVIPGLLHRADRAVITGLEGGGKSTCLRQIAICASQGIHPFNFKPMRPVSVLVVDLENSPAAIAETGARLLSQARRQAGESYDPARCVIWSRPGGIDLRSLTSVAELTREVEAARPELLILGPAYKAVVRRSDESWEQAAEPVQQALDDLRTRFGFAVVIEHHSPGGGKNRELRPYGSSLWLRWPEYGIGLRPAKGKALALEHWRDDRLTADWPSELRRDSVWCWSGVWRGGAP